MLKRISLLSALEWQKKRSHKKCVPAVLFIQFVNLKAQKLLVTKEEGVKTL